MKLSSIRLPASMPEAWSRLAPRDRQALKVMCALLLATLAFVALWQPSQQRLASAERLYQQRLVLAAEVNRARTPEVRPRGTQPLSAQLSERALADGLDLQQLEVQGSTLRLSLRGDARVLLSWLDQTEQDGAVLQSLTLDKRGEVLEAQLVVQDS